MGEELLHDELRVSAHREHIEGYKVYMYMSSACTARWGVNPHLCRRSELIMQHVRSWGRNCCMMSWECLHTGSTLKVIKCTCTCHHLAQPDQGLTPTCADTLSSSCNTFICGEELLHDELRVSAHREHIEGYKVYMYMSSSCTARPGVNPHLCRHSELIMQHVHLWGRNCCMTSSEHLHRRLARGIMLGNTRGWNGFFAPG